MKGKLKQTKGITLIALVITIIILLILAVVSIRLVMNDGIINKAENATTEYEAAEEKEQIELAYADYQMSKASGLTSGTLKVAGATVTGDETSGWTITFSKTGNVYTLSADGKTITSQGATTAAGVWTDNGDGTFSKGTTKVALGDYVNYNEGTGYSAEISIEDSGYTLKQTLTTQDLKWRVLRINSTGNLELISDTPTTATLYLKGENAYLYGVDIIDETCNKLYGKGTNAIMARNVNMNDIGTIENDYEELWRYSSKSSIIQHSRDNGTTWVDSTVSVINTFRLPGDNETLSASNADKTKKVTYNKFTLSSNSTIKAIMGTTSMQYVNSITINYREFGVSFAPLFWNGTQINYAGNAPYYITSGTNAVGSCKLRPVVTLSSDIQLSGSSASGWTIN